MHSFIHKILNVSVGLVKITTVISPISAADKINKNHLTQLNEHDTAEMKGKVVKID